MDLEANKLQGFSYSGYCSPRKTYDAVHIFRSVPPVDIKGTPTIGVIAPGARSVDRKFVPRGCTSPKSMEGSIMRAAPSSL